MVHLRVQKGSAFAFECCSAAAAVEHEDLQRLVKRAEDIEALHLTEVSIVKRLDLADVDRMIMLCRQHPPQCVLSPASLDHAPAFREFTTYLKQRQRAGVAPLANGYLLLLTPIPNWDAHLRCLVIKSKTAEQDVESVSPHSSVRLEEDGVTKNETFAMASESEPNSPKKKKKRKLEQERAVAQTTATEKSTDGLLSDTIAESSMQAREALFAQLRQEYRAFNAFHHEVLQEWISR